MSESVNGITGSISWETLIGLSGRQSDPVILGMSASSFFDFVIAFYLAYRIIDSICRDSVPMRQRGLRPLRVGRTDQPVVFWLEVMFEAAMSITFLVLALRRM
jgi:hypothetical protein